MGLKRVSRRRRIAEARPPTADTPAGERPEWLPEGWGVEMRRRGNDTEKFDQYYLSPVSGRMFRSKLEVFHHLATGSGMVENSEGQASRSPSGGGYNLGRSGGKVEKSEFYNTNKRLLAALEDYPLEWLPHGWFVEYGTWTDGVSGPENYKCYIDPLTGSRFYSKEAVVCYLETHKLCNPTLNEGGSTNANPTDFCSSSPKETTSMDRPKHVFCQIDYSPSGLPSGWIKEVRITKTKTSQKIRRDAYYIDTVTGYGFRSHKDADRYLEDKDDSRIAFKLYKSHLPKTCSLAKETLHPVAVRPKVKKTAVRGHLFSRQMQKSNVSSAAEISDTLQSPSVPSADHASIECDDMENCSSSARFEQLEGEDGKFETESQAMPHFNIEGFPRYPTNNMEVEGGKISDVQLEDDKILGRDVSSLELQFKITKKKRHHIYRRRKYWPGLSNIQVPINVNQPGPCERKAAKALTSPLRTSKLLAAVKADPLPEFGICDRFQRAIAERPVESKQTWAKDSDPSCGPHQKLSSDLGQQGMLNGRGAQAEQVTQERQVAPCMELPFVDSWPAPVIELAFKTLTRDDPVFEDIAAEYVQHHLRLVQTALPTGQPALVPSDGTTIKDDGGPSSLDKKKDIQPRIEGMLKILILCDLYAVLGCFSVYCSISFSCRFFFLNCCFFVFGLLMQSLFVLLLCKM